MSTTRKPSARQLFNQFLRKEKARRVLSDESEYLDVLATKVGCLDQIVEHEDTMYRVYTRPKSSYGGGRFELCVERLGSATSFRKALEVKK
jgi:hypothetical protein